MTDSEAADSFDDPKMLELLIMLARRGSELRGKLAPLRLEDAASIDVLVDDATPSLPLELVYAGPVPLEEGTRVCTHVARPPKPGEVCRRATKHVVCPYLFWGQLKTISRTVQWDGAPKPPPSGDPLPPYAVLYGATAIADRDSVDPLPSAQVLAAARAAFPTVDRVKTWRTWRKRIKSTRPRLLVLLGHTAITRTETKLYIGTNDPLARADIDMEDLLVAGGPPPLVLLVACSSSSLGDVFGTLPGALTSHGAGAVIGTLAKITGPRGATATVHLLQAVRDASTTGARVADAVAAARRSLLAAGQPIGLILVSHGEADTRVVA